MAPGSVNEQLAGDLLTDLKLVLGTCPSTPGVPSAPWPGATLVSIWFSYSGLLTRKLGPQTTATEQ